MRNCSGFSTEAQALVENHGSKDPNPLKLKRQPQQNFSGNCPPILNKTRFKILIKSIFMLPPQRRALKTKQAKQEAALAQSKGEELPMPGYNKYSKQPTSRMIAGAATTTSSFIPNNGIENQEEVRRMANQIAQEIERELDSLSSSELTEEEEDEEENDSVKEEEEGEDEEENSVKEEEEEGEEEEGEEEDRIIAPAPVRPLYGVDTDMPFAHMMRMASLSPASTPTIAQGGAFPAGYYTRDLSWGPRLERARKYRGNCNTIFEGDEETEEKIKREEEEEREGQSEEGEEELIKQQLRVDMAGEQRKSHSPLISATSRRFSTSKSVLTPIISRQPPETFLAHKTVKDETHFRKEMLGADTGAVRNTRTRSVSHGNMFVEYVLPMILGLALAVYLHIGCPFDPLILFPKFEREDAPSSQGILPKPRLSTLEANSGPMTQTPMEGRPYSVGLLSYTPTEVATCCGMDDASKEQDFVSSPFRSSESQVSEHNGLGHEPDKQQVTVGETDTEVDDGSPEASLEKEAQTEPEDDNKEAMEEPTSGYNDAFLAESLFGKRGKDGIFKLSDEVDDKMREIWDLWLKLIMEGGPERVEEYMREEAKRRQAALDNMGREAEVKAGVRKKSHLNKDWDALGNEELGN